MKRIALIVLLVSVAALVVAAAQAPRVAHSPDRLASMMIEPVLDMNGTCVAFKVRAKFQTIVAHPSGEVDATEVGSVEVDLMRSNKTVLVGDTVYDDKEVADILCAVAKREWKLSNPDPLPQRRRALRSQ